jgi:RNA polymerase sigma factor (sigma-70 family)
VGGVTGKIEGSDPDLATIYERMQARMLRMFGPQSWLDDVVHSAMETFIRKKHTVRDPSAVQAFADRIAINAARDWMRRQRRTILVAELFTDRGTWDPVSPGPAEEMEDRDRIRRLNLILSRLAPRYRIAYLLYHVENRTVPEIAEIENASEAAIRKRLTRARDQIHARARRDPVLKDWLESIGREKR